MKAGENLELDCLAMVVKQKGISTLGNKFGEIVKCHFPDDKNEHWLVEDKIGCYWWHPISGLLCLPDIGGDSEEISAILPKTPPKINNTAKELL